MKTTAFILATGLATSMFADAARSEPAPLSMNDITSVGRVEFGLASDLLHPLVLAKSPREDGAGRAPFISSRSGDQAARLRELIGYAEAGRAGYDAVQHGARTRPAKRPTDMTIGEIFAWIRATPGQPHAIGRYQFIPATLKGLVRRAGITGQERFSPALQDHLANLLLLDAGFEAVTSGRMSDRRFMYNLSGIWAGLPLPSGRSRYDGYAGNRATISWQTYRTEVSRIFSR